MSLKVQVTGDLSPASEETKRFLTRILITALVESGRSFVVKDNGREVISRPSGSLPRVEVETVDV